MSGLFSRPGGDIPYTKSCAKRRGVLSESHGGQAASSSCYTLLVRRTSLHTDETVEFIEARGGTFLFAGPSDRGERLNTLSDLMSEASVRSQSGAVVNMT